MNVQKVLAMFLVGFGLLLLANNLLGFDLNFFKVFLGMSMMVLGLMLVLGRTGWPADPAFQNSHNVLFGEGKARAGGDAGPERFSTLFGSQRISLEEVSGGGKNIQISTIFGETKVIIPADMPCHIQASALFGEAKMPDGEEANFGNRTYVDLKGMQEAAVHIHAQVVFGSLKFKRV
ncbi:MAG: LiaF domain-containing protein [Bacteroidia bacterium]